MKRLWLSLGLGLVIFLAVNLVAGLTLGSVRLDLTQSRIYSLSPVTADILKSLKEPITLRFYVSPALRDASGRYANYADHVQTLLNQYARLGHGKIQVETVAPEPFSPEEDRAFGFGLRGVPIDEEGSQTYFGIVGTNSTDRTETIPFLTPEREVFLEYDLTRLVSTLQQVKPPVVGLIDGAGTSGASWSAMAEARHQFTVRTLNADTTMIDPTTAALMIVHPRDLSPGETFAIDQYVLNGGHVLAFVDPDAETVAPGGDAMSMGSAPAGGSSDLPGLFKAWGIAYDATKTAADWDQAMRIQAESFGRPTVVDYPPYIAAKPPFLKPDDPVTGDLKIVNMITPGALAHVEGAASVFTPLIQTSPHAALVESSDAVAAADPLAFLAKYKPGNQPLVLAARVTGQFTTAFPNGLPKDAHAPPPPKDGYLKASAKPAEIIVAADVDMLSDHSWTDTRDIGGQQIQIPFASNGDFLINALESLTGRTGLSSLRARGVASRPLTRLAALERAADDRYRATQESLSRKLEQTQRQLLALSGGQSRDKAAASASAPVLNDKQQDALRDFRAEMMETRSQLRDVQRDLHRDIDRLEARLKVVDIGLMPLAVVIFAILMAVAGRLRR